MSSAAAAAATERVDLHDYRKFCFRGEGQTCFVIGAVNIASGRRIVWRFSKDQKTGAVGVSDAEKSKDYLTRVIQPLIGRAFLQVPKVVSFAVSDLCRLLQLPDFDGQKARSFAQLYTASAAVDNASALVGGGCVQAQMLPDLTYFDSIKWKSPDALCGGDSPTIAVELKPKQGFMAAGQPVPYCLNCLLQMEKWQCGEYAELYDYCPLDLFSGDLARMRRAVGSLVRAPHRNFRIFRNGKLVHSDDERADRRSLCATVFPNGGGDLDDFVLMVCRVLAGCAGPNEPFALQPSASVLSRLLAVQRLDMLGVLRACDTFRSLPPWLAKEVKEPYALFDACRPYLKAFNGSAPLVKYLIAATIKDCSVMLRVKPVDLPVDAAPNLVECGGTVFAYAVSVIDMWFEDAKSPKKLESNRQRYLDAVKIAEQHSANFAAFRRPCVPP